MPSLMNNLAPALIQTFSIILVGYVFGRFKLIPPEGMRAMGMFVTMLALPGLLLRSMITLDLNHVEWNFFLAILIAKGILFTGAIICAILKNGCSKVSLNDGGMYAIFVSQSNDFAMGIPILTGLFGDTHPSFPGLLYVVSPISNVILNPIAFVLMEYGREIQPAAAAPAAVEAVATTVTVTTATPNAKRGNDIVRGLSSPILPVPSRKDPADSAAGTVPSGLKTGPHSIGSPHAARPSVDDILHEIPSDSDSNSSDSDDEYHNLVLNGTSYRSVGRASILDNLEVSQDGSAISLRSASFRRSPSHTPMRRQSGAGGHQQAAAAATAIAATGTTAEADAPAPRSLAKLLAFITYKVFTNPVVLCSIIGIGLNFALGQKLPIQIDGFFVAIGNTFTGLALFILGVNMNGKLALFQDRRKLFLPLMLIAAKCIALPILIRLVIGALGVSGSDELTVCAFLVGTFPTAPSVHFYAVEFGARQVDLVAPAMVLGTFIAAPIMFVSAQMVTVSIASDVASTIASDSTRISAGFGFLGALYCILCFVYNRRCSSSRERLLLTLCAFQALYTGSVQWCVAELEDGPAATFRFLLVQSARFGTYIWMALMALNEVVRRFHGTKAERALYKWYNIAGCVIIVACVGGLQLFAHRVIAPIQFQDCWVRFGHTQWLIQIILLSTCGLIVIAGLIQLRGDAAHDPTAARDTQPHIDLDRVDLRESLLPTSIGGAATSPVVAAVASDASVHEWDMDASLSHSPAMTASASMTGTARFRTPNEPPFSLTAPSDARRAQQQHQLLNPPLGSVNGGNSAYSTFDGASGSDDLDGSLHSNSLSNRGGAGIRSSSPHPLGSPRRHHSSRVSTAAEAESFWLFAMKLQLFLGASSMLLSIALLAWDTEINGARVEIYLLDAVIFSCMGMATLALFAFSKFIQSPLRPFKKWIKRTLFSGEPQPI